MGAVSSHFRLSSQGHQVASAVRLCSRHVTLVALRDDGGYHLYYTYTSGHILRSVSLLWTIRRYRKMNDKTQSRNSRSCCDSCSRHYLSVLFLVGVGFGELRGDLQVLFFFFSRCRCEEFALSIWWGHFLYQDCVRKSDVYIWIEQYTLELNDFCVKWKIVLSYIKSDRQRQGERVASRSLKIMSAFIIGKVLWRVWKGVVGAARNCTSKSRNCFIFFPPSVC